MRSITCVALGTALGAALAGLIALGGSSDAVAHGWMYGYGPMRSYYRPVAPAPRVRAYRPPSAIPGSCGQFRYWSKGRCLDARTTPPDL